MINIESRILQREFNSLTRQLNIKDQKNEKHPKLVWATVRDHFVDRAIERIPGPLVSTILLNFLHVVHDNKDVLRRYDLSQHPLGIDVICASDDYIFVLKVKKSEIDIDSNTDNIRVLQARTIFSPNLAMTPNFDYINLNVDEKVFK